MEDSSTGNRGKQQTLQKSYVDDLSVIAFRVDTLNVAVLLCFSSKFSDMWQDRTSKCATNCRTVR